MLVLAHRGYHAAVPENTLAAFAAAVEQGVDGIETDVRLSRDGLPVLLHDRVLAGGRAAASLSRAEIEQACGHPVPTLDAALDAFPDLLWNVEVKTAAALEATVDILRPRLSRIRVLLTSFRHDVVAAATARLDVDAGFLLAHRPLDLGALLAGAEGHPRLRTLVWDYEILDEALVAQARGCGWRNLAYGAVTAEEHERCRGPLDGVITDSPELMR